MQGTLQNVLNFFQVLRLVKNTRQVLSDQLLTVFDPDNSPSDLVYSVLNSNAPTDMEGKILLALLVL